MADRVTYGPFTLYESEAYKARKKAEETRAQVELERDLLALKKAREEDPDFKIERAGELADRAREIEETLKGYDTQTEINKNQLRNITGAASLPGESFAGPVMPAEAAMSRMSPIDEQNRLIEARQNRLRSQLEAVDMQRQGLQGTVPLPEGMGSAPAGSFSTVFERRAPEMVALTVKAKRDIEATTDPDEREAKLAVYGQMKSYAESQTRKMSEESRKIPGLEGSAASEQAANEMRKNVADFAAAAQNIDDLIGLADAGRTPENFIRSQAIRGSLRGQLRVLIAGPGPMSDRDVQLLNEIIANPVNPFDPYAREKLLQLKGAIARKVTSSASVYGFRVRRIQDLIEAGGQPEDFKEFTSYTPSFRNEGEARAAGYKDGDRVKIGGVVGNLTP